MGMDAGVGCSEALIELQAVGREDSLGLGRGDWYTRAAESLITAA